MSELQATVEVSVEFHNFYNVDLFQRGFYQIRSYIKSASKVPFKFEVSLPKNKASSIAFPACVINGTAVTKTFQILYRNEEVHLGDIVHFRIHGIVEGGKIEELLENTEFQLVIELWYTENGNGLSNSGSSGPTNQSNSKFHAANSNTSSSNGGEAADATIACVSSRVLTLQFVPSVGLHYHLPVLFDYFHLSAVSLTVHAILTSIHQPYINHAKANGNNHSTSSGASFGPLSRQKKQSKGASSSSKALDQQQVSSYPQTMDSIFFGPTYSKSKGASNDGGSSRLNAAKKLHFEVCSLLLASLASLQQSLSEFLELMSSTFSRDLTNSETEEKDRDSVLTPSEKRKRFFERVEMKKVLDSEDDFLALAKSDISQLCGELVMQWKLFLDTVNGNSIIGKYLAKLHHFYRMTRFSEGFFVINNSRKQALTYKDKDYQDYASISENMRNSDYFATLPKLPISCTELDGDVTNLPIIYEDLYQDGDAHSDSIVRRHSLSDIKPKVLETPHTKSPTSCNANGDEMTLNELLSKEPCVTDSTGNHLRILGSVPESQYVQRQNCSLSVRKINRPASVPSTKKFDECGESISCTNIVDIDDLNILQDHLIGRSKDVRLGLPKGSLKDMNCIDNFPSFSSGYLSQDSFVDLSNKQTLGSIQNNGNIPTKCTTERAIPDEEYTQQVILPDSLSNEDEPMVLITKPCLPPGKKPRDSPSDSKTCMSGSKTVTNFMNHLSLKRDKKKTAEQLHTVSHNETATGFSHLEWSASVPYNLSEEPDDCKGMKHSHSYQSMPSVSEDNFSPTSRTSKDVGNFDGNNTCADNESPNIPEGKELKLDIEERDNEEPENQKAILLKSTNPTEELLTQKTEGFVFENDKTERNTKGYNIDNCKEASLLVKEYEDSVKSANDSSSILTVNKSSLSTLHAISESKLNCSDSKLNNTFSSKIESTDLKPELGDLKIKFPTDSDEFMKRKELVENAIASQQITESPSVDQKESVKQRRTREQKMLSQKLDEFRKNSRSIKADQIKLCSNRQMRAKSEDIIVKPSVSISRNSHLADNGKKLEKPAVQKRHSSSFGQYAKSSDIDKVVSKEENPKSQPLDEVEKNRRRLTSDSCVYYGDLPKAFSEETKIIKPKESSEINITSSYDGLNSTCKTRTHKLSAPKLVQAVSLNSSSDQMNPSNLDEEKSVCLDEQSASKRSKKSGALPSPPVEFKDPPSSCKTQKSPSVSKQKKETKSKFNKTNNTSISGTNEHIHPGGRCGKCMCVNVCKCKSGKNIIQNKNCLGAKTGSNKTSEKSPDKPERKDHGPKNKYDVKADKFSPNIPQETTDLTERKHNMFSNFRVIPPNEEEDTIVDTMGSNNYSAKVQRMLNKGASTDNELFVVDRRGSTVDCLESTPLPSPNLPRLNSKIEILSKNQSQLEQSSSQSCTPTRLCIKSNTELSIESVVTRHRRQFQNCHCCHCQNHNNYIQNYGINHVKGLVPSPSEDSNKATNCSKSYSRSSSNTSSSTLFSSKSFNFNVNGKDFPHEQHSLCTDAEDNKKKYFCLNQKYICYLQNSSSTKKNKTFLLAREEFKKSVSTFSGKLYSEEPHLPASVMPYFHHSDLPSSLSLCGGSIKPDKSTVIDTKGVHLIICVHGLEGNSADLRLIKTYLEMALTGHNIDFLMSEGNQSDTFSSFESMTDRLVDEILTYLSTNQTVLPSRISFVGHSLGTILIRSAIQRPKLSHLVPRFYTFLSLSGPHLGTLYNNSGLVNMGMWIMQKWKKSGSLHQLAMKDASDIRNTFMYKLAAKSNIHMFRNVLLAGSTQDRYVPWHSARIELCKYSSKDNSVTGSAYREMLHNIMSPIVNRPGVTLARYDIHHALPTNTNALIGRAAHIAVLDSELFIEKFLIVTALKYFQ